MVFVAKGLLKSMFVIQVYHIFKKKSIAHIYVRNGEHVVHVVVAGVDKATIPMHCYLALVHGVRKIGTS